MGDEGLEAFGSYFLFPRLKPIIANQLGAHTGAELSLSETVAFLIERWDELDDSWKVEIVRLIGRK